MTRWHIFLQTWYQFWAILHTLNRRAELSRLMAWAYHKKYRGPFRLYVKRSLQEEERLAYYAIRSPQLVLLARYLHGVGNLISPAPRYPVKGSAVYYRNQRSRPAAHV